MWGERRGGTLKIKMKWDGSGGSRTKGVTGGFTKTKEGPMANLMKTIY